MASVIYNIAKSGLMRSDIILTTQDIRAILLMTNTTADTDIDADTVSAITTLDECDATGAARQVFINETVITNDTLDRGTFTANPIAFSGLGRNASRNYQGVLVYKHITNDTDSVPLAFVEFSSPTPLTATDVNMSWVTAGIFYIS